MSQSVTNATSVGASSVSVGAVSAPFTLANNTCGATLGASSTCTFDVVFSPTSAGTSSQTLSVSYNDGSSAQSSSLGVSGTGGVSTLTLSPSGAFSNIIAGSTTSITITVNNATSYTASSVSVAALSAPFSVGSNTCGATVAAGASCTFAVTFAPTSGGTSNATATVNYSNGASATSATQALTATAGVAVLSLSASGAFPNTTAGATNPITITVSNSSGYTASSVSVAALSAPYSVSSNLCSATVVNGGSCTFVVTFAPTSAGTFTDTATVNYSNGAGATSATLALSAIGGVSSLTLTPSGAFPSIIAGSTSTITITANNATAYTASSVSVAALSAPFSVSNNLCGATVAGGASCTFDVVFSPTAAGTFPATATVNYSTGASATSATSALSGTAGVSTLSLSASGAFPNTAITFSNSITITVSNTSAYLASSVSVTALSAPFAVANNTCGATVAASGTCTFDVTFSPTATGAASDTATVGFNNGTGTTSATLALSATGTNIGSLSLTVADPSNKITTYTCAPVTVLAKDLGGSAYAVTTSTSIGLTGLGSGLAYATLSDCKAATSSISTIFFNVGEDHHVFYYRTSTAESLTLQAQATGYVSGSLAVTTVLFQVLGQINTHSLPQLENGESTPGSITFDGTHLMVTDGDNNRVLIWNSVPTGYSQIPDLAIGQPDLVSKVAGTSNARTWSPGGVFSDGTRLFVADSHNNRVLVWNTFPTSSGQAASFALGQPDLSSGTANNGGLSASSMNSPNRVYSDGTQLFVSDTGNHRVLVWNTMPTSSGQAASFALGQPDLTSATANNSGLSASSLKSPVDVIRNGTKLFVTDTGNNRVLVWNTIPTTSGQAADFALGQPDLVSNTDNNGGVSGSSMSSPIGVFTSGVKVFVADTSNHRVLVWNTMPSSNGQTADFALGQPFINFNYQNYGGVSGSSMMYPCGVSSDGTRLFVADSYNNRLLIWNTLPTSTGQAADYAMGQEVLTTNDGNHSPVSASTMYYPTGTFSDGTHLFSVDALNHRVLIWNTLPTTDAQPADVVLGQPNMTSHTSNYGGISASSLSSPARVYSDGTRLFVVDGGNNRVLVWNTIPTSNGQAANFALGQPNLTSGTANNGGLSASSMSAPSGVVANGTQLFVTDTSNHRTLIWNTMPTSSGQAASIALGQPDLSSGSINNGGLSASSMYSPVGLSTAGTKLFVVDHDNHRVLAWSTLPTTSGQAADLVLGQAGLASGSPNRGGGITAGSLYWPLGVFTDGTRVSVTDTFNHRVLLWNTMPSSSGQSADTVYGQPDFSSAAPNNGGLSASSMYQPNDTYMDGTRLFTNDSQNNRVTIAPLP